MLKKVGYVFYLISLSILFSCHTKTRLVSIQERGELVVAMDQEMPGYFLLGTESYGYQYDLFQAYAESLGVKLRIVSGSTPSEYGDMLRRGEVDLLTTLSDRVKETQQPNKIPIYTTSYVLLTGKKQAAKIRRGGQFNPLHALRGSRLLMSSSFQSAHTYGTLLDSLPGEQIHVSGRNSFELIESLGDGAYDYLICEMSEAQLGCALMRNVEQVYTFDEPVALAAVVSPRDGELQADFTRWMEQFRGGKEYAVLNDLYFNKGIVAQLMGEGLFTQSKRGISVYDKLIKQLAESEGYDWRLISAIAYSESRFNPWMVSQKGARGIMQVMPGVAKQFGGTGNIMDPEKNVLLALKVLAKIEKSLNFSSAVPSADRNKIMLACYNAGVGHVLDARNLARKYGANPDSWSDVSYFLLQKADPEVAQDKAVKCGAFNSKQTLAFVDQVTRKYNAYCNIVER